MGSKEPIRFKLWALIADAMKGTKPVKVEPKGRWRVSGPVPVPSEEWWTEAGQRKVTPQCAICHSHQLAGSPPLKRGLCGPCWQRTAEADDAA